ncbi:reticulocyte binding protein 3 [Plasmodium gonderi]|uniref:Reticulocyte binding protein 3 n=1 Tax=Plasmodium gonderi TaxID=77519 RepID=A0A1Y1JQV3_PLAGO|nr:reticulocyte binding protein 3 [Plasmodium gonderi]GAW83885.1 reticulocyte binding protein 3 [Plasmodium gonderi]
MDNVLWNHSEKAIYPINSNWWEKNELKNRNRKNKNLKKHNLLPEEKVDKKDGTVDVKDSAESWIFKNKSLVDSREKIISGNPSYPAYIKKSNTHGFDIHSGFNERIIGNGFNGSKNSFIQNVDNGNIENDFLDHFELIGTDGEIIFSFEPYYVDIYSCSEILHFINNKNITNFGENYDHNNSYDKNALTKDLRIQNLYNQVKLPITHCISEKVKILNKIHNLELPNRKDHENVSGAENSISYYLLVSEYTECLKKHSVDINREILKVKKSIEDEYGKKYCPNECNSSVYYENIHLFLMFLNNNADVLYNSIISDATEFLNSSTGAITIIEKIIGFNSVINSIKIIQYEFNNIIKNFNYHIKNIKNSVEKIKACDKTENSTIFNKETLVERSFDLAKNMSIYTFNNEMFNRIKSLYDLKKSKFMELFVLLKEILEDKINSFAESVAFQNKYDSIANDIEFTLAFTKDLHSKNSKNIKMYEGNQGLEAIIVRNKFKEKLLTLDRYIEKIEDSYNIIKSKYVIIMSAKSLIGELKSEFKSSLFEEGKFNDLTRIMETIINKINEINEGVDIIHKNYYNFKLIEVQIENISTSVNGYINEINVLKSKGSTNGHIREEIVHKMLYISENINNLKKITALEEKADENIARIDELIMKTSLDINEIINKKSGAYNNIKMIIKHLYRGDLKKFLDEMSLKIDKYRNNISQGSSTDELDNVLNDIKDDYEKMKSVKCDSISESLQNITNDLNIILDAKEEIIKMQIGDMNEKLKNSLQQFKSAYDKLKVSIIEYKNEKGKIEEHKTTIMNKEKTFFDKSYDKDDDMLEGKDAYENFVKYKDNFVKRRSKLFEEFHIAKEALKKSKVYLLSYVVIPEKYNIINDAKNKDLHDLTKEINNKDIDKKIQEYEEEFSNNNKLCDNIIKEIETSNKNYNNLKLINRSIKECSMDNELIDQLIKKKNALREGILSELKELDAVIDMEQNMKEKLKVKLNGANNNVDDKLKNDVLTELKTKINNILDFYKNSKEKYKELSETDLIKIKNNDEWMSAKKLLSDLNIEYEVLKKQVDDLINNTNSNVIKWIDNKIQEKNKEIDEKVVKHVNSFDDIIAKSKLYTFITHIDHYKNEDNKEKAKTFNTELEGFVQKINTQKEELKKIKEKSTQYLAQANIKKSENTELKDKKKAIKDIYEQISKVYEELNSTLGKIVTLQDLEKIELKVEKNEIDDLYKQITDEEKKSEEYMKEIESCKKVIDEKKSEESNEKLLNTDFFKFSEFYNKASSSHSTITTHLNELKSVIQKYNENEKISEVRGIKKKTVDCLRLILTNNSTLHGALEDIQNVKDVLLEVNFTDIINITENDYKEVERYSNLMKTEHEKSEALIKELDAKYTNVTNKKNEINKNLSNQHIDEFMKEIMQYRDEVVKKKKEMDTFLKNSSEYMEKALVHYHNAYRRKNKILILREKGGSNFQDVDIDKINNSVNESKKLSDDVVAKEGHMKEHGNRYIQHEQNIITLLKEASVMQIKIQHEKEKDKVTSIMKEINELQSYIERKVNESEYKLEECKKQSVISAGADILDNDMSKDAYISVKFNLEQIEYYLLHLKDIKESAKNILSNSTKLNDSIQGGLSTIEGNDSLDILKTEESPFMENLKKIENEKKLMDDEKTNVDMVHERVIKIENELEKSKKRYEEGILKKIKERADNKKKMIESTIESLKLIEPHFTEMYNELYLKEYNIKEKFLGYQNEMQKLYDEFNESYKKIETNATTVAQDSVKYDNAKKLREEAQAAEMITNSKEENAKMNLNKWKQHEFMNFILQTNEYLDKIMKACEEDNTKMSQENAQIEKIIKKIRKLKNEKSAIKSLQEVKMKNNEIKIDTEKCNKNKSHNTFGKMIKSSNFMGIKIFTNLGFELTPEMNIETISQTNSELKYESEVEIKPDNDVKLDYYKNLQVAYGYIQKIFKYSEHTARKQEEIDGWIKEGNNIYHDIKTSNELETILKYTKYKGNVTLNNINDVLSKSTQLRGLKCHIENYNNILENSEITKFKQLSDDYNKEKDDYLIKLKMDEIDKEFKSIMINVESLEKEFEKVREQESHSEIINDENSQIVEIHKKIDNLNSRVIPIVNSLNKLLIKGKSCEMSFYASITGNINAEISSDARVMNNLKENSEKDIEYIKKKFNIINDDIRALNKNFQSSRLNNYQLSNLEEAIKHSNDLNAKEKEATEIINDMKKEFIDVSREVEMNSLNDSIKKIIEQFVKVKDKIKQVKDIYKNINIVKLRDMDDNLDKYLEVAKFFRNILDTQNNKFSQNHEVLKDVEKNITENVEELKSIINVYTLQSIEKFNRLNKSIEVNMQKFHEIEEVSNNDEKQVKACIENISHIINRGNNLFTDLNDYDVTSNSVLKEDKEITNTRKDYIAKIKEKVNNMIKELQNLLDENIEKNKSREQIIEYLSRSIRELWKSVNDVKIIYSQKFPENDDYFQLNNYLNDIKDIMNEIVVDGSIEEYINKVSQNIQEQIDHVQKYPNIEYIMKTKENMLSYNEVSNNILQSLNSALDKIALKKHDMDNIFSVISVNMKNSLYMNTKKYINEADDIFNKLKMDKHKLEAFINNIRQKIIQLEEEKGKLKANRVSDDLNGNTKNAISDEDDELSNEFIADSGVNRNQDEQNSVTTDSEEGFNDSFHTMQGLNKYNKNIDKSSYNSQEGDSDSGSSNSRGKNSGKRNFYAGGFMLVFIICSVAGFTITNYKQYEIEEADLEPNDYLENDIDINEREKEEFIEFTINESEEYD